MAGLLSTSVRRRRTRMAWSLPHTPLLCLTCNTLSPNPVCIKVSQAHTAHPASHLLHPCCPSLPPPNRLCVPHRLAGALRPHLQAAQQLLPCGDAHRLLLLAHVAVQQERQHSHRRGVDTQVGQRLGEVGRVGAACNVMSPKWWTGQDGEDEGQGEFQSLGEGGEVAGSFAVQPCAVLPMGAVACGVAAFAWLRDAGRQGFMGRHLSPAFRYHWCIRGCD